MHQSIVFIVRELMMSCKIVGSYWLVFIADQKRVLAVEVGFCYPIVTGCVKKRVPFACLLSMSFTVSSLVFLLCCSAWAST